MSERRVAKQTRELIFEAASRILCEDGWVSLTLTAVAAAAGLSKGGLLYHFPNKVALIEALFEYHNDKFERRLAELTVAEGGEKGAWLRAYAKASVEQIADPDTARLYNSLFAAEERYATAHALMRQKYVNWQEKVEQSGLDSAKATLVRLAVDGLWFTEMHQYAPLTPERRTEILEMIVLLTQSDEERFGSAGGGV